MNTEAIMSGRMMFYGDPSFRASSIWVTLKEDPDLQRLQEAGISDDAQAGGGKALPQIDYADHGQMLTGTGQYVALRETLGL